MLSTAGEENRPLIEFGRSSKHRWQSSPRLFAIACVAMEGKKRY